MMAHRCAHRSDGVKLYRVRSSMERTTTVRLFHRSSAHTFVTCSSVRALTLMKTWCGPTGLRSHHTHGHVSSLELRHRSTRPRKSQCATPGFRRCSTAANRPGGRPWSYGLGKAHSDTPGGIVEEDDDDDDVDGDDDDDGDAEVCETDADAARPVAAEKEETSNLRTEFDAIVDSV